MTLPAADAAYLLDRQIKHQVLVDAGMTCILFPSWSLPAGYDRLEADLLLRFQSGYPDIPPDMWWFDPAIGLAGGGQIPATDVREQHLGRSWQRWSRHFQPGQWQSGIDGLESFLALIRSELSRHVLKPAA